MLRAVPRDRLRDVHERDGAPRDDDEPVDTGHDRDVQRDELAVRKRELAPVAAMEEPLPGRRYRT